MTRNSRGTIFYSRKAGYSRYSLPAQCSRHFSDGETPALRWDSKGRTCERITKSTGIVTFIRKLGYVYWQLSGGQCDDDCCHPPEKLEDDIVCQTVL